MKLLAYLAKAMEDSPGVPSSIRLQMFIICLTSGVLPLLVWAGISIAERKLAEIPGSVISMCTLLFGGATTAKVIQQRSE